MKHLVKIPVIIAACFGFMSTAILVSCKTGGPLNLDAVTTIDGSGGVATKSMEVLAEMGCINNDADLIYGNRILLVEIFTVSPNMECTLSTYSAPNCVGNFFEYTLDEGSYLTYVLVGDEDSFKVECVNL